MCEEKLTEAIGGGSIVAVIKSESELCVAATQNAVCLAFLFTTSQLLM